MIFRHIGGLGAVMGEVMQLDALCVVGHDEFPIAITHGQAWPVIGICLQAEPLPKDGAVAGCGLAVEDGEQVLAIAPIPP